METQLLTRRFFNLPGKKYKVKCRRWERERIYMILGDISENVKNNLTTVKGFAQLIRNKINGGLYSEYFEIIDHEIEKIVITVDSYRDNFKHK